MNVIESFVCPIYTRAQSGNAQVTGSGTLVTLNSIYFLITAAHVVRESENSEQCILAPSTLLPLKQCSTTKGDRSDKLDFAIFELDEEQILATKAWRSFYDLRRDKGPLGIPRHEEFALTGFPATKNKISATANRKYYIPPPSQLMLTVQHVGDDDAIFEDKTFNHGHHHAFYFHRQEFLSEASQRVLPPELHGLSGGGVWHLEDGGSALPTSSNFTLRGIIIEQKPKPPRVIATRLEVILHDIRYFFPHAMLA
jgi:hypothetical protein